MEEELKLELLRYPIGRFKLPVQFDQAAISGFINDIRSLPLSLETAVQTLDAHQLNTAYREGGWTVHQLLHHIPESHMNAFIRYKLALTENNPVIKPYQENQWVQLPDIAVTPVNVSLTLLHALHIRWVNLLETMSPEDFKRTYFHPGLKKEQSLEEVTAIYAWHGKHHLAHITRLKDRMRW
ncbi:MAG TPA: putative metal-dependent hydrolase [Chitinophagaceae bacterium]|nr:putative metal-dependent hydrolase [Chitinophagaceae bacterium]